MGASITGAYCERLDHGLWAEPINAATNAAFLIVAIVMWRRTRGTRMPVQAALIFLVACMGVGSFLFHTYATRWASVVDTVPIVLFIFTYLFVANRDFWSLSPIAAGLGTLAFIPYAAAAIWIFASLPVFGISAAYWPLSLFLAIYGLILPDRITGRGLILAAALLATSIVFRSIDMPLCDVLPTGTHFIWHLLNALMLAWIIEVHRAHLARRIPAR